jgi:hypothetical protein
VKKGEVGLRTENPPFSSGGGAPTGRMRSAATHSII